MHVPRRRVSVRKTLAPGFFRGVSGRRYYDPRNGRFINRDPIEETGGLNLYAFTGNNPVNRWDLLGMSWFVEYTSEETYKAFATDSYGNSGVWNFSSREDAERWAQAWENHDMAIVGDRAITGNYLNRVPTSAGSANGGAPDFSLRLASFSGWEPAFEDTNGGFGFSGERTWIAPNGLLYGFYRSIADPTAPGVWATSFAAPIFTTDVTMGYTVTASGLAFHSIIMLTDNVGRLFLVEAGPSSGASGAPFTRLIMGASGYLRADPIQFSPPGSGRLLDIVTSQPMGTLNMSLNESIAMLEHYNTAVNAAQLPYSGQTWNSNAYAFSALSYLGIAPTVPAVPAPGWNRTLPINVPPFP